MCHVKVCFLLPIILPILENNNCMIQEVLFHKYSYQNYLYQFENSKQTNQIVNSKFSANCINKRVLVEREKYPDQNVRILSHARHKTITKRRTRWLVPSSPARRSHAAAASRLFIAFKIFFDCSLITSLIIAIICMLYLFSQHVVPALTKCRLARHNS